MVLNRGAKGSNLAFRMVGARDWNIQRLVPNLALCHSRELLYTET